MVRLEEINEKNWLEVRRLAVKEEQRRFLDTPIGIIARGYLYRDCNSRVWAIRDGDAPVGLCLVRDLDEEPACYDLQQFMVDARHQGRGVGAAALKEVIRRLRAEGKYPCVEVCVHRDDIPALRMYEKAGFEDTGYVDEGAPECVNLRLRF